MTKCFLIILIERRGNFYAPLKYYLDICCENPADHRMIYQDYGTDIRGYGRGDRHLSVTGNIPSLHIFIKNKL